MTMPVIEFEKARITQRSSAVTLGASVAVLTETAAGTATDNPDVHYYIATLPMALDGGAYPSLVAVWDNEQDAIFDTL